MEVRQITSEEELDKKPNGNPKPSLRNAVDMLSIGSKKWKGVLRFNELTQKVEVGTAPPFDFEGDYPTGSDWDDTADLRMTVWFQRNNLDLSKEVAGQAVQVVARRDPFHPVQKYLNSLTWDGTARVESWLTNYLGVECDGDEHKSYIQTVGRCFLIGAVARAMRPGCKLDTALILEGDQGTMKSTAMRKLVPDERWFTDELADLGSKDASIGVSGVWIIELAELDGLRRSEVDKIKAFMTRTTDRFRPPHARHVVRIPRTSCFVGTVNGTAYLRDETGNRRFWPVKCGKIDLKSIAQDRDQIWAEALHLYRAGNRWWIDDKNILRTSTQEQSARVETDAWLSGIEKWLEEDPKDRNGNLCGTVTVEDILKDHIRKDRKDWNHIDNIRIGRCMKLLGWEKKREAKSVGSQGYYYVRPKGGSG